MLDKVRPAELSPELLQQVEEAHLPSPLGFARLVAPVMAIAHYRDGAWGPCRLTGLEPLAVPAHTQALHYGQAIFEGMKAHANLGSLFKDSRALLFRPNEHAKRFNRSALRLGMPEFPVTQFVGALEELVPAVARLIPQQRGQALYLRPMMFGASANLSVVPSTEYCFTVLAAPADVFFTEPIGAWIERDYCRAGPGGTGNVKAAGNYAASFAAAAALRERGFQQLLWLDPIHRTYLEEFTAMNVFVRVGGKLTTPPLSDTILAGIVRESLLRIAPNIGLTVEEQPIEIGALLDAIAQEADVELFGCGTGSVVAPVNRLGDKSGLRLDLPRVGTSLAARLRGLLLDMQHGIEPAPEGWVQPLPE
jgi:branched-chain amino acid aminotransferase